MNGTTGELRIDFGDPEAELEEVPWDDFLRIFEEQNLAFTYEEESSLGQESREYAFVERDSLA